MESPSVIGDERQREHEELLKWRYQCLAKAGVDYREAMVLADHTEVDLHQACEMAHKGCPSELLLEILL